MTETTYNTSREVYPPAQIPHIWAHGHNGTRTIRNGGSNNFYADGDTIYSYGPHFPIARRFTARDDRPAWYFTTERYSSTTDKHRSAVLQAIPDDSRIFTMPPSLWDAAPSEQRAYYGEQIDHEQRQAVRPRIRAATRERHTQAATDLYGEWQRLHAIQRYRCRADTIAPVTDLDAIREQYAEQFERERKAEADRKRKAEEQAEHYARFARESLLPKWRRGGNGFGYTSDGRGVSVRGVLPYPVLRLRGNEVESSHGATVPVAVAKRALAAIDTRASMDDVGGYGPLHVNGAGIRIGCHRIPWREVRDFCTHAEWPVPAPALAATDDE